MNKIRTKLLSCERAAGLSVNSILNSKPYEKVTSRVLSSDEISCCLPFGMKNCGRAMKDLFQSDDMV